MIRVPVKFQRTQSRFLRIAAVILCLLTFAPALQAQMGARISSARERQTILDRVNNALQKDDAELQQRFAGLRYPFRFVEPDQPATAVVAVEEAPVEQAVVVVQQPTVPDSVILEAIAAQLKPKGTLIRSDRRVIILVGPGGRDINLREGDEFTATYQDVQYNVVLHEVSTDAFSLRLNETVVSRPVFETSSDNVRFYRPEN